MWYCTNCRDSCTGHEIQVLHKERAREEAEWKTKDAEAIYWFFFFSVWDWFLDCINQFPESIFEQKNKRLFSTKYNVNEQHPSFNFMSIHSFINADNSKINKWTVQSQEQYKSLRNAISFYYTHMLGSTAASYTPSCMRCLFIKIFFSEFINSLFVSYWEKVY